MQRRQFIQTTALAGLTTTTGVWAQSAAWPDKPIKFVLSQPPGSGPDNVARLLGERLTKSLGQAIVIDNKPGGQNVIGAQAAARSAPDGYTFYFATTAALITNALLFKQLAYDPQKDFAPVAFIARSPFAILVDVNSPIQTLDDLIAKSKASGGQFSIGNEGPRTFSGMIARLFNARAKAAANLVPYANVGVGSQNLMGGHVDAMVADLASTAQLAKQGSPIMGDLKYGAKEPLPERPVIEIARLTAVRDSEPAMWCILGLRAATAFLSCASTLSLVLSEWR